MIRFSAVVYSPQALQIFMLRLQYHWHKELDHWSLTGVISNNKRNGDLVEVISISDRYGPGLHTWL